LYDLLAQDVPTPDLVIYLQTPTARLVRRLHGRARQQDPDAALLIPDEDYLRELNEAYQHFFFHYSATPLLVVEMSHVDFHESDEAFDGLLKQVRAMGRGTRYYVPRTS
jgi:deoxyadenosine/deoxycytidine kinase